FDENVASRPICGIATVNCGFVTVRPVPSLNDATAISGVGGAGDISTACASPRRFVLRSATLPVPGTLKLRPLKATAFEAYRVAATLAGCGPDPASTVNRTSVKLLA